MKKNISLFLSTVIVANVIGFSAMAAEDAQDTQDASVAKVTQAIGRGVSFGSILDRSSSELCRRQAANYSLLSNDKLMINSRCAQERVNSDIKWVMRTTVTIIDNNNESETPATEVIRASSRGVSYGSILNRESLENCQNSASDLSIQSTDQLFIQARCAQERVNSDIKWVMRADVTIIDRSNK